MTRRDGTAPLSLLAVGYGSVALATIFSMGSMLRMLDEMKHTGGGIAIFASGVWHAARMPLAAAWLAAAATVVALVLAVRSARDAQPEQPPKRVWGTGAMVILAGVVPVLAFQRAVAFSLDVTIPGRQPSWITSQADAIRAVYSSVIGAGIAAAICFFLTLVLIARIRRGGVAPRRVVLAVGTVSLVASVALIGGLQLYANHWKGIAFDGQPIESRISSSVERRQVYIGVSRRVNLDDSVSRSSCTRSRNSSAVSDSNATTKS
jgi:ABC-type Fe3+ transport system permease subunit